MSDVLQILSDLSSIDVEHLAELSLIENESVMADLNAEQMARGLRPDNSEITPTYSDLTIELKQGRPGLSGITDRVTLYETGEHYKKLYAEIKGSEYEMGSKDLKSEKLQKKYGKIYGLSDDSKETLVSGPLYKSWKENVEKLTPFKLTK
ncbi:MULTISPECIES: hypothetical protein [unclassified Paraflavitalea]|uniref:hypothetical protein n=1 Tax=unclassified Paraflavitalea TaxID=2798305 RepID=UPI003D35838A